MGLIIWIIIIIWVAVAVSKRKTNNTGTKHTSSQTMVNRQVKQTTVNQQVKQTAVNQQVKQTTVNQQELKARLAKKYNRSTEKSRGDILQRAKVSVEEDFADNGYEKQEVIYKRTIDDQTRKQEMERRVAEKLEAAEWKEGQKDSENVLRTVEDLMIMGPNTEMTFSRDFLAEGMDMLNRIQA